MSAPSVNKRLIKSRVVYAIYIVVRIKAIFIGFPFDSALLHAWRIDRFVCVFFVHQFFFSFSRSFRFVDHFDSQHFSLIGIHACERAPLKDVERIGWLWFDCNGCFVSRLIKSEFLCESLCQISSLKTRSILQTYYIHSEFAFKNVKIVFFPWLHWHDFTILAQFHCTFSNIHSSWMWCVCPEKYCAKFSS